MNTDNIICPVCETKNYRSLNQHLHFCNSCDIVFNSGYETELYGEEYFTTEYEKQYGKTYLQDYKNIYNMSLPRIDKIISLFKKDKPRHTIKFLDIGSALGFFLKCALDQGFKDLHGLEISKYGSSYCHENFNISVANLPFDEFVSDYSFDIVSAWYFLEHNKNPKTTLKKIYGMIDEGGILALSMPSIKGPQFNNDKEKWIQSHPKDHRVDFSPQGIEQLLLKVGFKKVYVRPASYHPERIISKNSLLFKPFSILYKLFARLVNYSDTIEVYGIK